jgi:transcription factor TFIIIB component B''
MTVGELTKDLGIGKRFRHAEEIEQRAREARAKYRLKRLEREKRKLGLLPPDEDDTASQPDTLADGSETRGAAIAQLGASMESGGGQGVGYDVVDGQIVVHAASLVVDRHNRDMQNYEEVEENDFTNCTLLIPSSCEPLCQRECVLRTIIDC